MLYYIVRVWPNGDEDVVSSWDNAEQATLVLENLRTVHIGDQTFRLDTVTTEKSRIRTHDFTLTELFGWYDGQTASKRIINCHECGAVVSYDNKMMNLHHAWHNKLLP